MSALRKTRCALAALLAAAAFAGGAVPKALAQSQPTPANLDITGVWIGIRDDPKAPYKNTPLKDPPLTAAGLKASAYWNEPRNNLGARCLPGGGPAGQMNGSTFFPIETIQKNGQITILYELMQQVRRVFTDGRGHPPANELDESWMGHSIGHWEGDTLVVDTIGMHQGPLNGSGAAVIAQSGDSDPRWPYSNKLHLTERLRMLDGGKYLETTMTLDDPAMYTRPFTLKRYWRRAPELTPIEYVCAENQRSADEGYAHLVEEKPAAAGTKPK